MSDVSHAPAKKSSPSGGGETKLQKITEGVADEAGVHDKLAKPFIEGLSEFFASGKEGKHH